MHNYTIGQQVTIKGHTDAKGIIKAVTPRKVSILLSNTTTGVLSEYTLRNDNSFIAVGYSKDDCFYGGYFHNNI